jgi:hypothetical protein
MTIRLAVIAVVLSTMLGGCRTGTPIIDRGSKPATQDGTIAGHVRTDGAAPVASRVVRAVAIPSGQKFETSTNNAGTYTLKVPPGRYRLEVELREGERLAKDPGETQVNASDLDPGRDFVIAVGR